MPDIRPTTRYVRPNPDRPGLKVALPEGGHLPPEGAEVNIDHPRLRRYWAAREREGAVITTRPDEVEVASDLIEACRNVADAGDLTRDGKPDVNAVADLLNRRVSAEERDDAWAVVQGEG